MCNLPTVGKLIVIAVWDQGAGSVILDFFLIRKTVGIEIRFSGLFQ